MKKFINEFKNNKFLWVLTAIILLVFVIRTWHFSDLLTFKMDQARDIKLLEEAYYGGMGELPLLGPRAAKTYLRLGPIFYYFNFISLKVFGDQPWAMAIPDFVFSILTIPLFYYFISQAFNKKISLLIAALFAFSFFLNQYGRFAWNPNSIPFWSLVYFLGLYKIVVNYQSSPRNAGRWLLVTAVGYGVASQLHFTAMLAYPLIGILFIIVSIFIQNVFISRKQKINNKRFQIKNFKLHIRPKYWLIALLILATMYLPMFLSERCTHWDNWEQFRYALSDRGKEEFILKTRVVQSVKLHSQYFYFTLTSWSGGANKLGVIIFVGMIFGLSISFLLSLLKGLQFPVIQKWINFFNLQISSRFKSCKKNNDRNIFKNKQKEIARILFFLLVWIWFGIMFLLYTKLAFSVLKPRYWLLEVPIFFIWLAMVLDWWQYRSKIMVLTASWILFILLVEGNLWATVGWYKTLTYQNEKYLPPWDLKLKDENMISWGQLQKVADYLEKLSQQNKNKEICFYTTGEYRPVYDYILRKRSLTDKIHRISFSSDTNKNCLFVGIDHHQHRDIPRIPKRHQDEFEKVKNGQKKIGFVTIWQIKRKKKLMTNNNQPSARLSDNQDRLIKDTQQTRNDNQSKEIHQKETKNLKINQEKKINNNKLEKPRRQERVKWKDVWNCHKEK